MNLPLLIVCAYMGALFLLSWRTRTRTGGSAQYLLAGRTFGAPLVAVSMIGLAIGGAATIGVAERAYVVGLSAGWYNAGWAAAAVVMAFFSVGVFRRSGAATVPAFFETVYGTPTRIVCVVCQLCVLLVITALQYKAGGAILASLLPGVFDYRTGMALSAAVFIGLAFVGGMLSSGLANIVNVALIFFGINLAGLLVIAHQGGLAAVAAKLPAGAGMLDPLGQNGALILLTPVVVMVATQFAFQAPLQIAGSARDERAARRGFLLAGLAILPSGFMAALVGVAARGALPDIEAAQALPQTVLSLHPVVAGLLLASLWAADVSTAVGLLLSCAALVRGDLIGRIRPQWVTPERELRVTRAFVLVAGAATYLLAVSFTGRIVSTLLFYFTLMVGFTVAFVFAVYFPELGRRCSAIAALAACAVVLTAWELFPAARLGPHPIYLTIPAAVLAYLGTALFDRRPIAPPGTVNPALG